MVSNLVIMGAEDSQVSLSKEKAKLFIFTPALPNLTEVLCAPPQFPFAQCASFLDIYSELCFLSCCMLVEYNEKL
jgi:hypothetical protein